MPVAYRKMQIEDEDAVFGLRMRTWGAPDIEYVRQGARSDPDYLRHTFVAIDAGGNLLSTVRYWVRTIRDASGTPQPVGCVASVVTVETARRQGHARKLMQLAIEEMSADGCAYALLESSRVGVPLYTEIGFRNMPLSYYLGTFSGIHPRAGNDYRIEHIEPPFHFDDNAWMAVRDVYAVYNAKRPLSLVRDDAYWKSYFARGITGRLWTHSVSLFLAWTSDGAPVAYLIGDCKDIEGEEYSRSVYLSEIGLMPGHEDALPALLSAFLARVAPASLAPEQVERVMNW